jgi:hypothetical protein
MKLIQWLVGATAALGLALTLIPLGPAQAMTPVSAGAAAGVKDIAAAGTTQVRFGGHFGGGHFGHFHGGGFRHFHGGFYHRHVFSGPRFYHRRRFYAGYYPYPYYAPVYRCPLVWTVYGPRRICGYRRHFVRYHYWRRHFHRHFYVHRYRHYRWM